MIEISKSDFLKNTDQIFEIPTFRKSGFKFDIPKSKFGVWDSDYLKMKKRTRNLAIRNFEILNFENENTISCKFNSTHLFYTSTTPSLHLVYT